MEQLEEQVQQERECVEQQEYKIDQLKLAGEGEALRLRVELVVLKKLKRNLEDSKLKLQLARKEWEQQELHIIRVASIEFAAAAQQEEAENQNPPDCKTMVQELAQVWAEAFKLKRDVEMLDLEVSAHQAQNEQFRSELFSYANMDKYTQWRSRLEQVIYARRRKLERFFAVVEQAQEFEAQL